MLSISNSSFNGSRSDVINGGVDVGNRAGDINPDDIATITVLKGAAASALYGQRAKNGAVIITTKRGKPGQLAQGVDSSHKSVKPINYGLAIRYLRLLLFPEIG